MSTFDYRTGLSAERVREVLDYDAETGLFTWKNPPRACRPGTIAGTYEPEGYIRMSVDGQRYLAHRLVWLWVHGVWPEHEIDHIDGNRANNRLSNLRPAERWLNMHNRHAPRDRADPTMPRGVTERNGRFKAKIRVNTKLISLGSYNTKEEAGAAYVEAAKRYAGDYTRADKLKEATVDWKQRAEQLEALLIKNGIAVDTLGILTPGEKA